MIRTAAALLAITLAAPAAAQDSAADNDLRCMAAYLSSAGTQTDPQQAMALTVGAMFYLGRLEGRDPDTDWIARIPDYAETVTLDELNAAAPQCAMVLRERGAAMVALSAMAGGGAD